MGTNIKITVVGDGIVGKTCLLISYTQNRFPEEYVPTVFEHYGQKITVDEEEYNMTLWDTAGQEDYERLRPLSYPNPRHVKDAHIVGETRVEVLYKRDLTSGETTDCFLVCFSVDQGLASYENVFMKWVPEVRHYKPTSPILLVATKIDLRDDPTISCYTKQDGKKLKRKVRANGYMECSAKTREGLEEIFIEAIRIYNKSKTKPQARQCVLL